MDLSNLENYLADLTLNEDEDDFKDELPEYKKSDSDFSDDENTPEKPKKLEKNKIKVDKLKKVAVKSHRFGKTRAIVDLTADSACDQNAPKYPKQSQWTTAKNESVKSNRVAKILATVDLTTPSPPQKTIFVNLGSDTDSDKEDRNYEQSIKIQWEGKVERHVLKRFQRFDILMDIFAKRCGGDVKNVVLMKGDKIIDATDSPETIDYRITDFLTGRLLDEPLKVVKQKKVKTQIKIKIQAAGMRKPLEIEVDKTKEFSFVLEKCAEALKVTVSQIKLKFDGEIVDLKETPQDLDFEGGEMIDCIVL